MKKRLIKTSTLANDVANYLVKQKLEVSYPLLEDHPSHKFKNKYFKLIIDDKIIGPDIFSFEIDEGIDIVMKKRMTPAQIAQATALAQDMFKKNPKLLNK